MKRTLTIIGIALGLISLISLFVALIIEVEEFFFVCCGLTVFYCFYKVAEAIYETRIEKHPNK